MIQAPYLRMVWNREVYIFDDIPIFRNPVHVGEASSKYERNMVWRLVSVELVITPRRVLHERVGVVANKRVSVVPWVSDERWAVCTEAILRSYELDELFLEREVGPECRPE